MNKSLTVGVDGSDASLRALDWAVAEASRLGLPLRVLYASLWDHYASAAPGLGTDRPAHQVMAENLVGSACERAARLAPDVDCSAEAVPDDAVGGLLRSAPDAFALVVGNRGRGELTGMLLGSTGLTVAGRAPCPVVVVRGGDPNVRGDFGRVTVGVGARGESSAAVRFAFRAAQARGAELDALHAWRSAEAEPGRGPGPAEAEAARVLDEALREARADHPGVAVRTGTAEDRARTPLLEASRTSDLLVVGAHHREGVFGLQLGQVNHALLHHASCPVAVVPQDA